MKGAHPGAWEARYMFALVMSSVVSQTWVSHAWFAVSVGCLVMLVRDEL